MEKIKFTSFEEIKRKMSKKELAGMEREYKKLLKAEERYHKRKKRK